MKVLVVGRTGQLAQALMRAAPAAGVEIAALGRPDVELEEADARQRLQEIFSRHAPDAVINAAAYTAVDKAEAETRRAFAVNAEGAASVAAAAKACGARLIHVSTDYVFSGAKSEPYAETDETSPATAYGASKLEGERRVAAENETVAIARTAWVYGPTGANFVRTMLRLAKTQSRVRVVADQHGCPTSADHLARALLAMAAAKQTGIFHCVGNGYASWAELARETFVQARRLGGPCADVTEIATSDYPTPAKRPANSRLNCEKLHASFGIRLPRWQDGVAACVDQIAAAGWDVG